MSDFHLGKGRYFRDGTQNILEDFIYDDEFAEFLTHYRTGDFVNSEVELILNGDILNLLQIDSMGVHTHLMTEKATVRAVQRIVAGHPVFFQALRRFCSSPGHSVSYVVGNHDVGMLFALARRAFCEAVGAEVRFYDVYHEFDGIRVEHGQQYESFAAIAMDRPFITRGVPEPVLNLPWGSLFVAVLLPKIKQDRPHVDKVKPFSAFLRWILIHDFWFAMKSAFKVAKFVIDTVLFRRRYQIKQGVQATFSLLKEITIYPNYDRIAFRILDQRDDLHTVVFGHTHILRYRQWREGKEYFNIGSWNEATNLELSDFGTQVRLTYAYIEYPPLESKARIKVKLKQWRGVWRPESDIVA
ncbi:MAG: hypothetical protein AAB425_13650 [Bdellovibrionota bacterium]